MSALLATLAAIAIATAQDVPADPNNGDADGPGRGVARISLVNGDVSIRRGDSSEMIAGVVNAPVTVGDAVITGPQSRAELQFDHSNLLRIGAGADIRLAELELRRYMLQLAAGTVTFRVLHNSDAMVELGTPSVAIRPARKGVYRVTVRSDGTSEITVRQGSLDVYTSRGSQVINQGQTMLARGETDPEFQVFTAPYEDEWDRWNQTRDQQLEQHSTAYQYVSPEVYGAEDLDGQGQWVNNANYGQVWTPAVSNSDWAPYRNGRWVWEDYYGWTWVSYDSWGWAPYHYGRWFWDASYGWCWWPGARGTHQYWRPALVGFFGFGSGFGSIGWVPLAPYEPFHAWWGRGIYGGYRTGGFYSAGFAPGVNLTAVYRNARFEHAITGVSANQFGRGAVNAQTMTRVTRGDLMNSGMVRGALPVGPDRASLHAVDRMPRTPSYSQPSSGSGRFYSTRPMGSVNRVPFEQQRQAIGSASQGMGGSGGGGWRRVNEPPPVSSYPQPQRQASQPQPMRMSPAIVQPRPASQGYPSAAPQYRPSPSQQQSRPQAPPPSNNRGGTGSSGGRSNDRSGGHSH